MTTSELFTGAYVRHTELPGEVFRVHQQIDQQSFSLVREGSTSKYVAHLSTIEGIPITREWLDKLGLEYTGEDAWVIQKRGLRIEEYVFGDGTDIEYLLVYDGYELQTRPVKYVHNLQGLVLHLTGELLSVVESVTA